MTPQDANSLNGRTLGVAEALALAFRAGEAYRTGCHKDFKQTHLDELQTLEVLFPRIWHHHAVNNGS